MRASTHALQMLSQHYVQQLLLRGMKTPNPSLNRRTHWHRLYGSWMQVYELMHTIADAHMDQFRHVDSSKHKYVSGQTHACTQRVCVCVCRTQDMVSTFDAVQTRRILSIHPNVSLHLSSQRCEHCIKHKSPFSPKHRPVTPRQQRRQQRRRAHGAAFQTEPVQRGGFAVLYGLYVLCALLPLIKARFTYP